MKTIPPAELRPYLIDAVERGMARCLAREGARAEEALEVVP